MAVTINVTAEAGKTTPAVDRSQRAKNLLPFRYWRGWRVVASDEAF